MKANHAFAPAFTFTSRVGISFTYDLRLNLSGVGNVDVTIPTGVYHMALAPAATDFLRVVEAAINAALPGGHTLLAKLSDDGIVTWSFTGGAVDELTLSDDLWRLLGFELADDPTSATVFVGVRPVWYLGLMPAATGAGWQPQQAGGSEQTTGGLVYTVAASNTTWMRSLKLQFQPTDADFAAEVGSEATPMYPPSGFYGALGATDIGRPWSILDLYVVSRNVPVNAAIGNWLSVVNSTSETFYASAYIANSLALKTERLTEEWRSYEKWQMDLVWAGAEATRA